MVPRLPEQFSAYEARYLEDAAGFVETTALVGWVVVFAGKLGNGGAILRFTKMNATKAATAIKKESAANPLDRLDCGSDILKRKIADSCESDNPATTEKLRISRCDKNP